MKRQLAQSLSSGPEWSLNRNQVHYKQTDPIKTVSVIIPSYNQGEYLEAAIRSVLLQNYPNIECIVIDGGSTDQSKSILERYDSNLHYWQSQPDDGQSAAINEGIKKATGQIMMFLNSDDLLAPRSIYHAVEAFRKNPKAVVVHGNRILLGQKGNVLGWIYGGEFTPRESGYTVNSECAYWRVKDSKNPPLFNDKLQFALDLDFFCRLYQNGLFIKTPNYLGLFRVHQEAKSATMLDVCEKESKLLWREYFGIEYDRSQWIRRKHTWKQIISGIKQPSLILLPWIKNKFFN